jgi:hypothetical protein
MRRSDLFQRLSIASDAERQLRIPVLVGPMYPKLSIYESHDLTAFRAVKFLLSCDGKRV